MIRRVDGVLGHVVELNPDEPSFGVIEVGPEAQLMEHVGHHSHRRTNDPR